ncbi:hypothetical protein Poli38472_012573 [Pythium oligandrum]|uniref:FYVE-type domain-containing protein n=1 Tax=Pythium oligandrum TaxID=41045 RepID=A0A8K1FJ35_PYTOL|nr:hypothetical protein Poli38472_012573 [Pythium oligandrum]|eukprot:TMW61382.1 hypothetical protein Poli38472_012573 [Pythium oligandrum]
MKATLPPSSALPLLELTPTEKQNVTEEVAAVLAETLEIERAFLADRGPIDRRRWKVVKSRDDVHVYRERTVTGSTSTNTSTSGGGGLFGRMRPTPAKPLVDGSFFVDDQRPIASTTSTVSTTDGGLVASMKAPHIPMIVASGNVEGALEDSVFGTMAGDEIAWRLRSTYMKDRFADAKILATIKQPTLEDPFDYLAIKWFVRDYPILMSNFVAPRDSLVAEATGLTLDEFGNQYGYYIVHQFFHPSLPHMRDLGVYRCKISLCFVSRQVSADQVHIFARGFVDPGGNLSPNITLLLVAETMLSSALSVDSSNAKKLTWLLAQKQKHRRRRSTPPHVHTNVCEGCHKTGGFLKSSLSLCRLCDHKFCSRCTVQRKLIVDMSSGGVTERPFSFCFPCMLQAKQLSPYEVAVDTVQQRMEPIMSSRRHIKSVGSNGDLSARSRRTVSTESSTDSVTFRM